MCHKQRPHDCRPWRCWLLLLQWGADCYLGEGVTVAGEGVFDDGVGGPMGESAGLLSAVMAVPAARCFLTILARAF